jgi:hypothetical protein
VRHLGCGKRQKFFTLRSVPGRASHASNIKLSSITTLVTLNHNYQVGGTSMRYWSIALALVLIVPGIASSQEIPHQRVMRKNASGDRSTLRSEIRSAVKRSLNRSAVRSMVVSRVHSSVEAAVGSTIDFYMQPYMGTRSCGAPDRTFPETDKAW